MFRIMQLVFAVLLLLAVGAEITAWICAGRVSALGYPLCLLVLCLVGALVKIAADDLKEEEQP